MNLKSTWLHSFLLIPLTLLPIALTPPAVYRHGSEPADPSKRPSSLPYISGDTFRSVAHFCIDEYRIPFDPSAVKDGDIIFLKNLLIEYFFTQVHPEIKSKYILITHNDDAPSPGKFENMLEDSKLIAWFAQNSDLKTPNAKFFPIPIGIANRHWPHGNIDVLNSFIPRLKTCVKNKLLYLNIATQTNTADRNPIQHYFADKPFCTKGNNLPWHEYLTQLAQSKFVVSPHGNGLDCHRTWETLLMGSYPVVKSSTLDCLYQDLPVVIVNDWQEVTEELLIKKYEEFSNQTFKLEKIYAQYWLNLINNTRENYLKTLIDGK